METLRINIVDTFSTAKDFFIDILNRRYNVELIEDNPDYVIFGDDTFGVSHHRYDNTNAIKIFYTGENVRPTYFDHHYAITFDEENSPRHYRLPLYVMEMYTGFSDDYHYLLHKKIDDPEQEYLSKARRFCTFVVSNWRSSVRNQFFQELCKYKIVDSGGPHMNNIGYVLPRDEVHYKRDFLRTRKFNIAFENQTHYGYVTEKILDAFYSNTVPIYWGSKSVHRDFNPNAFINCHGFRYFNDVIEYIKHLDSPEGKKEYLDMLTAPAFLGNRANEYMYLDRFLNWFDTFVFENRGKQKI